MFNAKFGAVCVQEIKKENQLPTDFWAAKANILCSQLSIIG